MKKILTIAMVLVMVLVMTSTVLFIGGNSVPVVKASINFQPDYVSHQLYQESGALFAMPNSPQIGCCGQNQSANSGHFSVFATTPITNNCDEIFTVKFILADGTEITHNAYFKYDYILQDFPSVGIPTGSINPRWVIVSGGTVGAAFEGGTAIYADMVVRAMWDWRVTFDVNGGIPIEPQEVAEGANATAPTPTRRGFAFRYWTYQGVEFDFDTYITGNITLVAVWDEVRLTVTFEAEDAAPIPNQEIGYGETVTLPTQPTRQGFVFRYWAYEGKEFLFTTPVTSDKTLVAVWDEVFTLTFNSLLGATHTNRATFTAVTPTFALENPSAREGWTFVGWYTAPVGGTRFTQIVLGSTDNHTLYARWADARPPLPNDFDRDEIENYLPEGWTPEDGWPEHPFPYSPPQNWTPEEGFPWLGQPSFGDNLIWWGWLAVGGAAGFTLLIVFWLILFRKKIFRKNSPKEGN